MACEHVGSRELMWKREDEIEERERERDREREREREILSTITCPRLRASYLSLIKPLRRQFSSIPAGVQPTKKFDTKKMTPSVTVISISTSLTLTESRAADCQHTDNTETTHTFSASPTLLPRAQ